MAMGAGALIAAAAASVYIMRTRRHSKRNDGDMKDGCTAGNESRDDNDVYRQLGISEENLPEHVKREIHKERKRKAKVAMISMKSRMYDNVYMLDEERRPMCTISMKKARWYVKKGIAEWSSADDDANLDTNEEGEVRCIRLLFQHNGSKFDKEATPEQLYLRSSKKNICVACGDDGHHIRHYIVPYAYRTLLPDEYKSHMSHDIVILCPNCHLNCERPTKRRMKAMERELRARRGGDCACDVLPVIEDPRLHHVRGCAIALVKWKSNIPAEKIALYEKEVREYLAGVCNREDERRLLLGGKEELTKSQLQKACGVNYRVKNPRYVTGAEVVVSSLEGAKQIEDFILDWREYFIDTVNPQFMPTGWRVDNPVVCGSKNEDADGGGCHSARVKMW